jgi:hypothetical protein
VNRLTTGILLIGAVVAVLGHILTAHDAGYVAVAEALDAPCAEQDLR